MTEDRGDGGETAGPQREVVAFLSRPESYGTPAGPVERIETHCSSVFLVGERAYKLKHAIAFASLDYTTLALRERACRAELALNGRTSPALYLEVLPVCRTPDGGLALGRPGVPLDWVVVMRRFAQSDIFERLAEDGRLTRPLMLTLGEQIARFHEAAEPMPGFGGAAGIRNAIEHNLQELRPRASAEDGRLALALTEASLRALDRLAPLLERRRAAGLVRRGHGDLRLANICLFRGRPTLFDCIEFCDEISCIDRLYDLAFLLMDLRQRGLDGLAAAALGRYAAHTGESEGLAALPLFISVRAATRSYAVAGAARRRRDPAVADRLAAQAQALLGLARAALDEPPPRLAG